jgi:hypothetical protein
MAFKTLIKEVTGRIEIYRFHGVYRLTSTVQSVFNHKDLDDGLDEFLHITVSDTEFGAAIRRCHDATRFVDWRTLPKGEAARADEKEWNKKYVLWQRKALEVTGCQTVKELYAAADISHSCSTRTKQVYAFFNSSLDKPTEFYSIPERSPDYREFIINQPASDETLGQTARAALDAVVHGAKPPPDNYPYPNGD